MSTILLSVPVLAVCVIFSLWTAYHQEQLRRAALRRQRVAYLLWVLAQRQ